LATATDRVRSICDPIAIHCTILNRPTAVREFSTIAARADVFSRRRHCDHSARTTLGSTKKVAHRQRPQNRYDPHVF
jgi:hypothetical protein